VSCEIQIQALADAIARFLEGCEAIASEQKRKSYESKPQQEKGA
jgi:hypothetical protein